MGVTSIMKVYKDVRLEWEYTLKASKYMNGYTFSSKNGVLFILIKYMNR